MQPIARWLVTRPGWFTASPSERRRKQRPRGRCFQVTFASCSRTDAARGLCSGSTSSQIDKQQLTSEDWCFVDVLAQTSLCKSKREAREFLQSARSASTVARLGSTTKLLPSDLLARQPGGDPSRQKELAPFALRGSFFRHADAGASLEVRGCITQAAARRAMKRARSARPESHGTVVTADAQTNGRGRQGRSWFSPPGDNLYLSLLLRPSLPASGCFRF